MKGLLDRRAAYLAEDDKDFTESVMELVKRAGGINAGLCTGIYGDYFVLNGVFPQRITVCATPCFRISWPASRINEELGRVAPHLEFSEDGCYKHHEYTVGFVRLKPEPLFPK
jgi:hypothetical protein